MLSLGFISLAAATAAIILIGFHFALKRSPLEASQRRSKWRTAFIGLVLWALYLLIVDYTDVINSFELPPRFPIFLILPLFAFTAFFLYRNRNSPVLHAIPKSWPVYFQSFRLLIESLFVLALADQILPVQVTFEGYNFDMLFAATAIPLAYLSFQRKLLPERVVLWWNYLGLAVIASIIFLFTTTFFFPSVWGASSTLASEEVFSFAFMVVPGFLMPAAVFMHFLSIIQLRRSLAKQEQQRPALSV
ncbi:MAG: hypothetical protein AAFO94_00390 [Bacteroidota bacterium]